MKKKNIFQECAVGEHTFGHEVAHMFGAGHNPEAGTGSPSYSYGQGKLISGTRAKTIMAYVTHVTALQSVP